jgi:hypothetical protein
MPVDGDSEAPPIAADRYYQGTIVRLNPGSRTGWLRSSRGRELPFVDRDVQLIGAEDGFASLRVGLVVGFDLGRTSSGLCATTIRVYERA